MVKEEKIHFETRDWGAIKIHSWGGGGGARGSATFSCSSDIVREIS